jgi:hypothetical protein
LQKKLRKKLKKIRTKCEIRLEIISFSASLETKTRRGEKNEQIIKRKHYQQKHKEK